MNSLFLSPERTIGYPALWSKTTIFCIFALAGIGGIAFYYKGTFYDENRSVLIRYIVYSFILLAIIASKFLSSKGTVGLYRRIVCCIFALACGAFFVKGIIDGSYELAGRIAFLFALSACVYIYIRENFAKTLYECKADKITVEKTGNAAALIEALNFMKRNETNKNALKVIEKRINGLNKTFQF
ncbi:MAG: hypothetical protein LBQ47_05225 [Endomicrobium sp.]|nr:hypothetical protein [Endomicrobium sp.]